MAEVRHIQRFFTDVPPTGIRTYPLSTKSGVILNCEFTWHAKSQVSGITIDSTVLGLFLDSLGHGVIGEMETVDDTLVIAPNAELIYFNPFAVPAENMLNSLVGMDISSIKANNPHGVFKGKLDLQLFMEPVTPWNSAVHDVEMHLAILEL